MNDMQEETVVINTLGDIKRALEDFNPSINESAPKVATEFVVDGKKMRYEAPTGCGYPDLLVNGFTMLKNRNDVLSKVETKDGLTMTAMDARTWVDDLVERRLGGKREGLRVRWDISDGTYYYDPFAYKLTKSS